MPTAAISVPPDCVRSDLFFGGVIDPDVYGKIAKDEVTSGHVARLIDLLSSIKADAKIIVRPEIYSTKHSLSHLSGMLPDLRLHVCISDYARSKYLKGFRNVLLPQPIRTISQLDDIAEFLAHCPRAAFSAEAVFEGTRVAGIEAKSEFGTQPRLLFPPSTRVMRSSDDPIQSHGARAHSTKLEWSPHSSSVHYSAALRGFAAHAVAEEIGSFGERSVPTIYIPFDISSELPTALAVAIRDLALAELGGAKFRAYIVIDGVQRPNRALLNAFSSRLKLSFECIAAASPYLRSAAIRLIVCEDETAEAELAALADFVLLLDPEAIELRSAKTALAYGVCPVLLSGVTSGVDLVDSPSGLSKIVLEAEERVIGQTSRLPVWALPTISYPRAGAVRAFLQATEDFKLDQNERARNGRIARQAFESSVDRLSHWVFEEGTGL